MQYSPIVQRSLPVMQTSQSQPFGTLSPNQIPFTQSVTPRLSVNRSILSKTTTKNFQSESGKIKCLEVLSFNGVELERTIQNMTTFLSTGILKVLYIPNFDRFVLSLNDWKYALLRRIPIVSSDIGHGMPIIYTLPTLEGHFTLKLTKIAYLEGLQNFETILLENSRFSIEGPENIPGRTSVNPNNQLSGQRISHNASQGSAASLSQRGRGSHRSQAENLLPGELNRSGKIKRGFHKAAALITKRLSKKEKLNINLYQLRDVEEIKRTCELMVPLHLFHHKQVEEWINLNKEAANAFNFVPEGWTEDNLNCDTPPRFRETENSRRYGSVDFERGSLYNPVNFQLASDMITSDRKHSSCYIQSSTVGPQTGAYARENFVRPGWMDKMKSRMSGSHTYTGERSRSMLIGKKKTSLLHESLSFVPPPRTSIKTSVYQTPSSIVRLEGQETRRPEVISSTMSPIRTTGVTGGNYYREVKNGILKHPEVYSSTTAYNQGMIGTNVGQKMPILIGTAGMTREPYMNGHHVLPTIVERAKETIRGDSLPPVEGITEGDMVNGRHQPQGYLSGPGDLGVAGKMGDSGRDSVQSNPAELRLNEKIQEAMIDSQAQSFGPPQHEGSMQSSNVRSMEVNHIYESPNKSKSSLLRRIGQAFFGDIEEQDSGLGRQLATTNENSSRIDRGRERRVIPREITGNHIPSNQLEVIRGYEDVAHYQG